MAGSLRARNARHEICVFESSAGDTKGGVLAPPLRQTCAVNFDLTAPVSVVVLISVVPVGLIAVAAIAVAAIGVAPIAVAVAVSAIAIPVLGAAVVISVSFVSWRDSVIAIIYRRSPVAGVPSPARTRLIPITVGPGVAGARTGRRISHNRRRRIGNNRRRISITANADTYRDVRFGRCRSEEHTSELQSRPH